MRLDPDIMALLHHFNFHVSYEVETISWEALLREMPITDSKAYSPDWFVPYRPTVFSNSYSKNKKWLLNLIFICKSNFLAKS